LWAVIHLPIDANREIARRTSNHMLHPLHELQGKQLGYAETTIGLWP
jgi:hypothetical protein